MVAKQQFRVTTDTLSPLFKASIGFDQLVNEFFNEPSFVNTSGYPPYNIAKGKDEVYEITLAVAGFKKSDIEIELEDGTLKISGQSNVIDNEMEFLHKGIAERNFTRTFKLAEFVEVKSASLEDGLLRVSLFKNVPDSMKPQKIKIS